MTRPKTAVVVGATNGIGKAVCCRLAREGFQIIAVGRDREGRKAEVLRFLERHTAPTGNGDGKGGRGIKHEFRPCDAFELFQVQSCALEIAGDYAEEGIDALIMTQGMGTIQGFTPTSEGNDEKLTLHYWSRAAFSSCLLPALRSSSSAAMPGGPVVMTVLSGGVHSPYAKYKEDPELKRHYSITNAANFAGYYTDLFFDKLSRQKFNERINYIHAAPGFVATNWGTEMPVWLRVPIRGMQKVLGKSPEKCANFMVRPILQCAGGKLDWELPTKSDSSHPERGLYIMKEDGTPGKLSKGHTVEAMDSVWATTKDVLGRAGIDMEE